MMLRAVILFIAKTIVTSLSRDIYSDRLKNNIIIKFSLCSYVQKIHKYTCYNVRTVKINLFKSKRFKDGRCTYKNTGSSHLNVLRKRIFFLIPLSTTFWNPKILGFLFVYEK